MKMIEIFCFKCDCGWSGKQFDMIPVYTPEGVWDKCPDCGNVSDDMEDISCQDLGEPQAAEEGK